MLKLRQVISELDLNYPNYPIAQTLNLPEPTVQSALDLLKRHDVAETRNENWRIAIELFRRWLLQENVQRNLWTIALTLPQYCAITQPKQTGTDAPHSSRFP